MGVHNIVPCLAASPKQGFAAATFRPRIERHLPDLLEHLPPSPSQFKEWPGDAETNDVSKILDRYGNVEDDKWAEGSLHADRTLGDFVRERLPGYAENRNDPNLNGAYRRFEVGAFVEKYFNPGR